MFVMKKSFLAVGILCVLVVAFVTCKTKIDTHALNTLTSLSQIAPAEIKTDCPIPTALRYYQKKL